MKEINKQLLSQVLDSISLESIFLKKATIRREVDNIKGRLKVALKDKPRTNQDGKNIISDYTVELIASAEEEKNQGIRISVTYRVIYLISNEKFSLTTKYKSIFNQYLYHAIVWPYFREYLQNSIVRMNLPPLTLPFV